MPLKMIRNPNKGGCAVIVACDHCDQRIADVKDGNALWAVPRVMDGPCTPLYNGQVFYTHKRCNRTFENAHRDVVWLSNELKHHIGYLCYNTKFNQAAWENDPMRELLEGL